MDPPAAHPRLSRRVTIRNDVRFKAAAARPALLLGLALLLAAAAPPPARAAPTACSDRQHVW
jgi:hypothetical protein